MVYAVMSDTGRMRSHNEDAAYATSQPIGALSNLFIIADGMGGHQAGEYAAHQAIEVAKEVITEGNVSTPVQLMNEAITTANESVYEEAKLDVNKSGMGTTFVAATIEGKQVSVANVGDSRLYLFGTDGLRQITRDHSVVEEMVRKGEVDKEQARLHPKRNWITRAVGAESDIRIDFFDEILEEGQLILMCTDGLTSMVEDAAIADILSSEATIEEKVHTLVETANQNGGKDNITVIVINPFIDEVKAC